MKCAGFTKKEKRKKEEVSK